MSKSAVIATAAGLSVAAVVGGAFAASTLLGGGGAQPEDVLPANTLAFVKVDMDPGAGQKVNVYKLAKKFESVDAKSADDLKDSLLSPVFADSGVNYDTDIKPWLGERAALAAVPHAEDGAAPLMVVEFTDKKKMEAGLAKAEEAAAESAAYQYETLPPMGEDLTEAPAPGDPGDVAPGEPEPEDTFAWAVRDNFVLISTDQATADAAAAADDVLADDTDYAADIKALGGDQIVTAWMDLEATYAAVPDDVPGAGDLLGMGTSMPDESTSNEKPEMSATGSVVLGVSAQSDHVEMVAKSIDVSVEGMPVAPSVPGTGMVADFPADTVAALSVSGLGATMTTLYDSLLASGVIDTTSAQEMTAQYGVDLPADLETVFGTDLAAGVRLGSVEDFDVFGKVRTDDPARATSLIEMLDSDRAGDMVFTEPREDHYVLGSSPEALALPDAGGLAEDPAFEKVVADAADANSVGFVDIAALVDLFMTPEDEEYGDFKPLDAFGFSAVGDESNSTVTARLSVR